MRSHYSATCRGCVFPIGCNASSVASLITGLQRTPQPTSTRRDARRQCTSYDSNALVTRALHYLLSSAMLPQIVHYPEQQAHARLGPHRHLVNKPPTPASMSMPPRNGRQFNQGRGRGDLLCTQNHRKTEKRKLTLS